MTFLRNTLLTLFSNVGMTLLGLLTGVLLARTLGPTGRGLMTTVLIWPQMLVWAAGLSVGIANIYYGAAQPQVRRQIFANSFWMALLLGGVVGAAAVALLPHFVRLTPRQHWLLAISLYTLPIGLWMDYSLALLTSTNRFDRISLIRISAPVVTAAGLLLLWAAHSLTVTSAVVTTWAGGWTQIGLTLWFSIHNGYVGFRPSVALLRRTLAYSSRIHLGTLAGMANGRLDQLVMTALVAPKSLGLYAFAVTLAEVLRQVSSAVSTVLFPKLAGEADSAHHPQAARIVRWTLLVSALGAAALFVAAPILIRLLWGPRFLGAVSTVRVLIPGVVAMCVSNTLGIRLFSVGKTTVGTWAEMTSLIVMLPLLWLLLPRLGIFGAGLASTCGNVAHSIVTTCWFARAFGNESLRALRPTHGDWHEARALASQVRQRLQSRATLVRQ